MRLTPPLVPPLRMGQSRPSRKPASHAGPRSPSPLASRRRKRARFLAIFLRRGGIPRASALPGRSRQPIAARAAVCASPPPATKRESSRSTASGPAIRAGKRRGDHCQAAWASYGVRWKYRRPTPRRCLAALANVTRPPPAGPARTADARRPPTTAPGHGQEFLGHLDLAGSFSEEDWGKLRHEFKGILKTW